jgi:hypothetical protein
MRLQSAAIVLLLTATGCSESRNACGTTEVCSTGTADLAVTAVSLRSTTIDPHTGRVVVQPDAIDVTIVLRNLGDASSTPRSLLLQLGDRDAALVQIPAILPAHPFTTTVRLDPPDASFLLGTDSTAVSAIIVGLDDDDGNDARVSAPFHLALPVLRITTTFDSSSVRGVMPLAGEVTVENISRYAALGPSTLMYCLSLPERTCTNDTASVAFGSVHITGLAPESSLLLDRPLRIPLQAVDQNRILPYAVATCVAQTSSLDVAAVRAEASCAAPHSITFVPDYETCGPVRLAPDQVASPTTGCNVPCDIAVFSLDVQTGHSYFVETDAGQEESTLRWRTRFRDDPEDASLADGFQPLASGRLYLVTAPKYCGMPVSEQRIVVRDVKRAAEPGR